MWNDFFAFCAAQGGPVQVRAAASAAGLTPRQIRRRADREAWWQPFHDVVAPPGTPLTPVLWGRAALAHARGAQPDDGPPVALTRWSAAAAYGVQSAWPSAVQVAIDVERRLLAGKRFEPHRLRGLTSADVRLDAEHGLAVLTPHRLVRELAAVAGVPRLTTLVIDLVQRRHLEVADLRQILAAHRVFVGRPRLRAVADRLDAAGRTDAGSELDARQRLCEAGVPLDPGQIEVACADGRTVHLDLGIAAIRFAIEFDSMLAHSTRRQLRTDVRRSNALVRLPESWRVLRMTVEDLDDDWEDFIALVGEIVTEQSRRWLGRDWP